MLYIETLSDILHDDSMPTLIASIANLLIKIAKRTKERLRATHQAICIVTGKADWGSWSFK